MFFKKKYNKNIKRWLAGLIAATITIFTLLSCNIFPPVTHIYFIFRNMSSYDVIVEYSGKESRKQPWEYEYQSEYYTLDSNGVVSVLVPQNTVRGLLSYSYDGEHDGPSEDDFSSYLHYFKVFIDDSLVYAQDPADISLWPQPHIGEDDNITDYLYAFNLRDSLISYEQIP